MATSSKALWTEMMGKMMDSNPEDEDAIYKFFDENVNNLYGTGNKFEKLLDSYRKYGINFVKSCAAGTLLIAACWKNYPRVANLLLENGADPNIINNLGSGALDAAVYYAQNDELAINLVKHGAVYNKVCDETYKSIYKVAEDNNMVTFCKYLDTKPDLIKKAEITFELRGAVNAQTSFTT